MNEETEKTSLMDKYIKLHLGGATYRVRLMTLLLFAAAAVILIAAILILAFSGSCAKSRAAAIAEATPTATVEATAEPTEEPTATPEAEEPTETPEAVEPTETPEAPETTASTDFKTLEVGGTNDGETVKKVQQRLVDLHYLPYPEKDAEGKGVVTTTYGSMCSKAITKFQERNSLKQTGKCDKETYDKLMSDKATAYTMNPGRADQEGLPEGQVHRILRYGHRGRREGLPEGRGPHRGRSGRHQDAGTAAGILMKL